MKVDISRSNIGHAPNHAVCKIGQKIDGTDDALLNLPTELVDQTFRNKGVLPKAAAIIVAGGCPSNVDGLCTFKKLQIRGACVEL